MSLRRIARSTIKRQSVSGVLPALSFQMRATSTRKSWMPSSDVELQNNTTTAMINEITELQKEQVSRIVPWFLKNMPIAYFKQIPADMQSQHMQAITTIKELMASDLSLKMVTQEGNNDYHVTYINSGTASGLLCNQIKGLVAPAGHELSNVNVFSSLDNSVALNVFSFHKGTSSQMATMQDAKRITEYIAEIKAGKHANDSSVPKYSEIFSNASMEEYVKRISSKYASKSSPRKFLIQRQMYEKVRGTEGATVHMEPYPHLNGGVNNHTWITLAAANVLPEVLLRLSSSIINARGLDISRAHLDSVVDLENSSPEIQGNVTMLRLLVSTIKGDKNLNNDAEFAHQLTTDLKRCKWLDNETTDLGLHKYPALGLDKAEVITALCSMLHGPLSKNNSQAFSSIKSVIQTLETKQSYIDTADSIAALFLQRFNPKPTKPLTDAEFQSRSAKIQERINLLQNDSAGLLLSKMLQAVQCTLRTNFYNEDRYALSLRVDPVIMATGVMGTTASRPLPFGVFFSHGRHFNAFHCRFRDIARGGLRIVTPNNSDQYALESTRQFDEVYGLSFAQQLKNKDIPEGGAKGVILVNTPSIEPNARFFAMRKSVKAFADSMLDLIVKDSVNKLVDFYNKDELIYFGPDEQIIPSDIEWFIARAGQRGYPLPAAFMSSKRENGFNHKEFGVTSEGVVVYLDVALRRCLNINPVTDPFTIKITGGPDGDVAGNLIKMLYRDYGDNCKVVGIADGFGVAEDPNGLDRAELTRLVEESLPITSFNTKKLSAHGIAMDVTTEEGIARRNTMHNRIKSDAFVPAGGRPNSINMDNWQQFLDANGEPSSKLIVEGANIFITPDARQQLFEKANVAIVKDSSANKCGVVTSSCEVQASMLLSKEEFMKIKPELVADVITQLRHLARLEGELLFREYRNYPGALPHFSERISFAIAKVRDAVAAELEKVGPEDPLFKELFPLVKEGLPKKLVEVAGDRISKNFPVQYQRCAIASVLASKLVYKEGIHLVEIQATRDIADRAFQYYRQDKHMQQLVNELDADTQMNANTKSVIKDLLVRGGARTSLSIF